MTEYGVWPTELTRTLTDCLDAIDEGNTVGARELAERSVGLAVRAGPVALANAVLVTGIVEQGTGDGTAARCAYINAAHLVARHLADPVAVQIYLHARSSLAGLHRDRGDCRQAERVLELTLAAAVVHQTVPSRDLAMLHNELGVVSKYLGKFDQAARSYRQALDLLGDLPSPAPADLATIWHNIGGLAHARGDYGAAEAPARCAVALRVQALGLHHPAVATDRAALAPILLELGQLDEAEALLCDALGIFESAYGADNPNYAIALGNLATLTHQRGDHTAADVRYRQALTVLERALGPNHPDLAAILVNYAALRRALADPETAEALEPRTRAILTTVVQPDHPTLATLTSNAP
ncbi:tetratricopeptide repeat protein [Streptomyces sp. NPDC047028]|uniref:tetratricopeptide repeat protein n=1 Tax=Streptomyces sp. NPDC047028 TaxID=3155793 RepID=UPI0033E4FF94